MTDPLVVRHRLLLDERRELRGQLRQLHSVLDRTLGDSDPVADMSEEDFRERYPVVWVAQRLAAIVHNLED